MLGQSMLCLAHDGPSGCAQLPDRIAVHLDPGDPCGYVIMLLTCKCMKLPADDLMVQWLAELPAWSLMNMVPDTSCAYMMVLPAEALLRSALSDPCAHVVLPTRVFLGLPLGGPCKCVMLLVCDHMMPPSCEMAVRLLMLLPTWSMPCMGLNTPCERTMLLSAGTLRRVVLSDLSHYARTVPRTEMLLGLPPGGPMRIHDVPRVRMYDDAGLHNGSSTAGDAAYLVHPVYGSQRPPRTHDAAVSRDSTMCSPR